MALTFVRGPGLLSTLAPRLVPLFHFTELSQIETELLQIKTPSYWKQQLDNQLIYEEYFFLFWTSCYGIKISDHLDLQEFGFDLWQFGKMVALANPESKDRNNPGQSYA